MITWVFEEGSFVPTARITDRGSQSIVADYLGTPTQMYDAEGNKTWEAQLDIYGRVRTFAGRSLNECPFRYQGQYQDSETGLYYNRFRYYDPEIGSYISQDPIGLAGGNPTLYAYVKDVNSWVDVFGLDCQKAAQKELKRLQQQAGTNSHFYDRHGAQTSLMSQHRRANTGLTPDGFSGRPVNSSKFTSHTNQLEAAQKAIDFQSRFGTGVGREIYEFDMGKTIGVGYGRGSSSIGMSSSVKAVFENGNLITMYPTL